MAKKKTPFDIIDDADIRSAGHAKALIEELDRVWSAESLLMLKTVVYMAGLMEELVRIHRRSPRPRGLLARWLGL